MIFTCQEVFKNKFCVNYGMIFKLKSTDIDGKCECSSVSIIVHQVFEKTTDGNKEHDILIAHVQYINIYFFVWTMFK